jgi:hypothetical protein
MPEHFRPIQSVMRLVSSPRLDVPFAVAVCVGPKPEEVDRLIDLADSLSAYERGPGYFVMVDDADAPRRLDRLVKLPATIKPISLDHPRHGKQFTYKVGKGICSAVMQSMLWIQQNTDANYVVKVDTDSLFIGSFSARLGELFEEDHDVGIVGAYTRTPSGTPRDFSHHAGALTRLMRPGFSIRHPLRSLRDRSRPHVKLLRKLVRQAAKHGYQLGEHCLGGGYAVSRGLLDRLVDQGLAQQYETWMPADVAEDAMMGLHCRAVGMTMRNSVDAGEVFGVRYIGLADAPAKLAERGYAVIHAVKNDPQISEVDVRKFFATRRSGLQGLLRSGS